MLRRAIALTVLIAMTWAIVPRPAEAQTTDRFYDIRSHFASEQTVGPVAIRVVGMNPFRTSVTITSTATPIAAVDASQIFTGSLIPTIPAGGTTGSTTTAAKTPEASAQSLNSVIANSKINPSSSATSIKKNASTIASDLKNVSLSPSTPGLISSLKDLSIANPSAAINQIINAPNQVAQALAKTQPVAAVQTKAPPDIATQAQKCNLDEYASINSDDLAGCLANALFNIQNVSQQLIKIRSEINDLTVLSDAVLARHPLVQRRDQLLALQADVEKCIIHPSTSCSLANPHRADLASVTITQVRSDIKNVASANNDLQQRFARLSVAAVPFQTDAQTAQLKAISTSLLSYQQTIRNLRIISNDRLGPMEVAGEGMVPSSNESLSDDAVLVASKFEIYAYTSCRGLGSSGVLIQKVININRGSETAPENMMSPDNSNGTEDSGNASSSVPNTGTTKSEGITTTQTATPSTSTTTTSTSTSGPAGSSATTTATQGSVPSTNPTSANGTSGANPSNAGTTAKTTTSSQSTSASTTTEHYDVTLECLQPVFLSTGIGVSTLSQPAFQGIAANTAGLASGTPALPSIINQTNSGTRPLLLALANYSLGYDDDGGGLAISAGLGTTASFGGSASIQGLAGLSYTLRRAIVFSGGVSFGQAAQLGSGYSSNGPITAGTTPPTNQGFRAGLFFGLTFVTTSTPKQTASPSSTTSSDSSDTSKANATTTTSTSK